jgi:hypothetical protein
LLAKIVQFFKLLTPSEAHNISARENKSRFGEDVNKVGFLLAKAGQEPKNQQHANMYVQAPLSTLADVAQVISLVMLVNSCAKKAKCPRFESRLVHGIFHLKDQNPT